MGRSERDEWALMTFYTSFYIYSPCGLACFVRNGEYYKAITDDAGSTRLVLKDGRGCMAAYDLLPYGQLMRWSGDDPTIVDYLFTGQEWDRETGLYNFHFRLYDPLIAQVSWFDASEPRRRLIGL